MLKSRTLLALSALLSTALLRADFDDDALSAKTNAPIVTKAPHSQPSGKKGEKKSETKKPEKFEDEKPFDEIVKNMDVTKGLFTFYRKADENKIYLEITTNQFEK